ncbi:hypothetical protein EPR50_G00115650 [Perca flavescens]|uniref:Uncharacterized protein n=1 Tax=Perca flavescens TaxID=8167 RepID=A0A484CS88_PERFV|nr:hypothetical protein EPR50_G00115650 [Perca flavescens]
MEREIGRRITNSIKATNSYLEGWLRTVDKSRLPRKFKPVNRGGSHIKFLVMQWSQRHIQISRCLCPSLVCSGSLPSALQLRWL